MAGGRGGGLGDAHSHGHDGQAGPRPDIPAAWAFKAGARGHIGRTNGEYYARQKELAEGRVGKGERTMRRGRTEMDKSQIAFDQ